MANNKIIERKKEVVNEIASKVKESSSIILFEYKVVFNFILENN